MSNQNTTRSDIDSPCIGTCSTVKGDKICSGCLRSFDEILLWQSMSDDEKRSINARIEREKLRL